MQKMHSDSMEGSVLGGRYHLQERIGVGGMSVVYRALDSQTDRTVAVKTLKEEYCDDLEFVKRFQNEVKATAELQHPNIVQIYDLGQENGMPYIVMEFIEGITLKDYVVALQTIKWRDALNITAQILSAVDCAHEHGVIHRDIKPQNIMITEDGKIKLMDFGIAHAVSNATKSAGPDSAGSVHYLSPEQARGGFVDERSDIYSIGITLYEMVTSVVPFDGESHVSIALKHIDGNIVPPHTVDSEIPYGVSDLIMMATKKDPAERFQSAKDMFARLKRVMENPSYSFLNPAVRNPEADRLVETEKDTEFENYGRIPPENGHNGSKKSAAEEPAPAVEVNSAEIIRSVTLTTVAYVLAVLLGIAGIVFVVYQYRNLNRNMDRFTEVKYRVENYVGMQADGIVAALTEKGFQVTQVPIESEEYPTGYVVRQSAEAGTLLDAKSEIQLYVSSLSGSFVLENYTNEDYRAASARLGALGLEVVYQPVSSARFEEQKVVRTAPAAGSIVVAGDTVTVYWSTGQMSETVQVPNLAGLTLQEAVQALQNAGLRVGRIYPNPGEDITELLESLKPSGTTPPSPTTPPAPTTPGVPDQSPSPTPPGTTDPNTPVAPSDSTPPADLSESPEAPTPGTTDSGAGISRAVATQRPGRTGAPSATPGANPSAGPSASPGTSASPSPGSVMASVTVVGQYPARGTVVYVGETVDLYFYDVNALYEEREYTMDFPADVVHGANCAVRIESKAVDSTGIATILFNSSFVTREEFPLRYSVRFAPSGAPVRVTVYVDGQLYRELLLYP